MSSQNDDLIIVAGGARFRTSKGIMKSYSDKIARIVKADPKVRTIETPLKTVQMHFLMMYLTKTNLPKTNEGLLDLQKAMDEMEITGSHRDIFDEYFNGIRQQKSGLTNPDD